MYEDLIEKRSRLAVIGLGYVGLPIALAFAKKVKVIGYDIKPERVILLQQGTDPSRAVDAASFVNSDILFTSDIADLQHVSVFIVTVPTPVDDHNVPDLSQLKNAAAAVGSAIKKNGYVIFESTVYPGCTEEECIPLVETVSGLQNGRDFKYGYSPERMNPGDRDHTLGSVIKIVSGNDAEAVAEIARLYQLVVEAGVHVVSSVKVAEAAKIIENTQRDLNIALMNELSIIFGIMNIQFYEVLEAAATKWNFLSFTPGLVGGHCIGVDPYYLTYKAAKLGYNSNVILSGRSTNDAMPAYIAKKVLQHIIEFNGNVKQSRVLVMGATFKENVADIRNSKVAVLVQELQSFSINVHLVDPYASHTEMLKEYGFGLVEQPEGVYDAVIIAVTHSQYLGFDDTYFAALTKPYGLVADIKGIFRNRIRSRAYWSL